VIRHALYFTAPCRVDVLEEPVPPPAAGQVLVQTLASAISPGTELLIYRGQAPTDLPLDETITALSGGFEFPLKYGYSVVGRVIDVGPGVSLEWRDRLVFAFHPHESHFLAASAELMPLPEDVPPEDALFLANMETAVTFLMDGQPIIGEQVAVFGQGIVGLLTTALLTHLPLTRLVTLDRYPLRRQAGLSLGAHASLDPAELDVLDQLRALLEPPQAMGLTSLADPPVHYPGFDLTYELSGAPAALDQAIAVTGFSGRVVIGSWYGQKRADLDLGGRFHRSRIRLIGSQVSTLAPAFTGRWTAARRLSVAWDMIRRVQPARFITQRFPINQASQAYAQLDHHPSDSIQVILTYP
jgi:threonine dehydrogenase-like Zn-dependent dehydrogenase